MIRREGKHCLPTLNPRRSDEVVKFDWSFKYCPQMFWHRREFLSEEQRHEGLVFHDNNHSCIQRTYRAQLMNALQYEYNLKKQEIFHLCCRFRVISNSFFKSCIKFAHIFWGDDILHEVKQKDFSLCWSAVIQSVTDSKKECYSTLIIVHPGQLGPESPSSPGSSPAGSELYFSIWSEKLWMDGDQVLASCCQLASPLYPPPPIHSVLSDDDDDDATIYTVE